MNHVAESELSMREKSRVIPRISMVVVLCALAIGLLGNSMSLLQKSTSFSNAGSIRGVGVGIYWDSPCTNRTSSVNWGALDPGASKTVTVYVRNEGTTGVTLSKATQNWNPSTASSYMTLNWNYSGQTLSVNQVLQVKLTLTVSSTVSGITSFSFDITITGTG